MIAGLPSYAVVVPTRNRPHDLRRCLIGVDRCAEIVPPVAVVVVDDGSTVDYGEELAVVTDLELPLQVLQGPQRGPGQARNAGAAAVADDDAEVLVFIDDDAVPARHCIELLLRQLAARPDLGAVGARIRAVQPERLVARYAEAAPRIGQRRRADGGWNLVSVTIAVRRSAFDAVGGYDPAFARTGEDVDLCRRLEAAGYALDAVPDAVAFHRHPTRLAALFRRAAAYRADMPLLVERYGAPGDGAPAPGAEPATVAGRAGRSLAFRSRTVRNRVLRTASRRAGPAAPRRSTRLLQLVGLVLYLPERVGTVPASYRRFRADGAPVGDAVAFAFIDWVWDTAFITPTHGHWLER